VNAGVGAGVVSFVAVLALRESTICMQIMPHPPKNTSTTIPT
jgi:hypothetical protein